MKLRFRSSRSVRKFLRHRMAVVSLLIIVVYLSIAAAVMLLDLVTLAQTEERVGPFNLPGFSVPDSPEKRLENASVWLEVIERALGRNNPQQAIEEIHFGNRTVADKSPGELEALVERGWEVVDELAESDDLNHDANVLPRIAELENLTDQLFRPLSGREAWVRWFHLIFGTDRQGRSISLRAVYSTKVAIQIGAVTALLSVLFGSLLGTAAGFFGGWVDHLVTWLYTTFASIPNLVLLVLLAYMFTGGRFDGTLIPVYVAFIVTFWIGPCRVIRGETIKMKHLEYVQAATAIGFSRPYIMVRHILPNAAHLMLINFSLLFIGAIKSEVILSFLGLGVKRGPSWGIMISQSGSEVINGFFWQIGVATAFMFILVLAFNILSDALQDVFDPKHT